jgi:hypothetical protein
MNEKMQRIAQLAAHHYCDAPKGTTKPQVARMVRADAEMEGIIASDGTYDIAVEAIDCYEDVRETYR